MCQLTSIVMQDKNRKNTTTKPQQEVKTNATIDNSDTNATPHIDKNNDGLAEEGNHDDVKELLIIGAGPHALTLLLRLLELEPDFLTEKERSRRDHHTKNIRSNHDVRCHIKNLIRRGGTNTRRKSNDDNRQRKKKQQQRNENSKSKNVSSTPPPLELNDVLAGKISIVDMHGDWMSGWKENFDAIKIKQLRSLMNAHADPYDHRSLEYYAEMVGRDNELILLRHLTQRDKNFSGPYHTTTTELFNDFHELLINSYGINKIVEKGYVESICPKESSNCNDDEPIFEIKINYGIDNGGIKIVKSKRIVCAMGPNFISPTPSWQKDIIVENNIKSLLSNRGVLSPTEIVPWLKKQKQRQHNNGKGTSHKHDDENPLRILIVGGGITSAQLTLLVASSSWCESVTLLQRSTCLCRQFDVENEWMGAARGKYLDNFWLLDVNSRAARLKEARRGGSIPPEIFIELCSIEKQIYLKEEIEIAHVEWTTTTSTCNKEDDNKLNVTFDDGSSSEDYDMIWLSTGATNMIMQYPPLVSLEKILPLQLVNGLPVLSKDLSWLDGRVINTEQEEEEPTWKQLARKRCWCMGVLAGLELGPDSLNLVGARHGYVRVAQAIRRDMMEDSKK